MSQRPASFGCSSKPAPLGRSCAAGVPRSEPGAFFGFQALLMAASSPERSAWRTFHSSFLAVRADCTCVMYFLSFVTCGEREREKGGGRVSPGGTPNGFCSYRADPPNASCRANPEIGPLWSYICFRSTFSSWQVERESGIASRF